MVAYYILGVLIFTFAVIASFSLLLIKREPVYGLLVTWLWFIYSSLVKLNLPGYCISEPCPQPTPEQIQIAYGMVLYHESLPNFGVFVGTDLFGYAMFGGIVVFIYRFVYKWIKRT